MSELATIYLVHHSHTDVGYTHDQPMVWELYRRFLDAAIDACERDLETDADWAMRWTVETTAPLLYWLRSSSDQQVERFLRLAKAGRIEVTAMFANLTPLCDTDELVESLQPLRTLRADFGLDIRSAMNCDVNGHNWTLADVLLDAGIDSFSMAINEHFGGAPLQRPMLFWWQGPSGRKLLAFNGFVYVIANWLGVGSHLEAFRDKGLPKLQAHLKQVGWTLPVLMLQVVHPFGDNGSVWLALRDFVRRWNEQFGAPRLRIATPREWWDAVRPYADQFPTYRGDWTDFWNFGCISSARETAINRQSRVRLLVADQLFALLSGLKRNIHTNQTPSPPFLQRLPSLRAEAWRALLLWDEHTWGADISVRHPESDDTVTQWHHKAHYAYHARSLSLMLQRDGIAELTKHIQRSSDDALVAFNPLPWERTVVLAVPPQVMHLRGTPDDPSSSRHSQDRDFVGSRRWWLKATQMPAIGYCVIARSELIEQPEEQLPRSDAETVENEWHRLTFDRTQGGIVSWWDKRLERELVDATASWAFASIVYERVADLNHQWARSLLWAASLEARSGLLSPRGWHPDWKAERWSSKRCLSHQVTQTPIGIEVIQVLEVDVLASPVTLRMRLPFHAPHLEIEAEWLMGLTTHPEATYLVFPFAIPNAVAHLDIGGCAMRPEVDQLPGCCRDYFTVQRWVDLSNEAFGVTVACPINPMVQLSDFHFAHNQQHFVLERAMLLGWVTNNYWETNFRAHQAGLVRACYWLLPHLGGFDEAMAHRFGAEASVPVVLQSAAELPDPNAALPRSGSFLQLPQPPVLVLHVAPAWAYGSGDGMLVRLLNASDEQQTAQIGSGLLRIRTAALCDVFGTPIQPLTVVDECVTVELPPRRMVTVRLQMER